MPLYVICCDHGYEGWSPPLMAARTLEEAKAALNFMRVENPSLELWEVPEWPEPPNQLYGTKPIEET